MEFPPHRTHLHPRMHPLLRPPQTRFANSPNRIRTLTITTAITLLLPFLLFASLLKPHHRLLSSSFLPSSNPSFGIIIECSPAGSRIHVFESLAEARISVSASSRLKRRLGEFDMDPDRAGESLSTLLEFARERVPRRQWRETRVSLIDNGALAGIAIDRRRRRILESCSRVLRSSGFRFRDGWVSSITGEEKGIYAWIATNYVLGTLGAKPQDTMGIIELGGASSQIVFVPQGPPPAEYSRMVELSGVTYNLYSKSMNQFSQDAAWESLVKLHNLRTSIKSSNSVEESEVFPCIPNGYNQTSDLVIASNASVMKTSTINMVGNFSACRSKALILLQGQDTCTHPPCRFRPTLMPELQGKPLSGDKIFYISELFGLIPRASLLDVEAAGHHYCEDYWGKIKYYHSGIDDSELLKYCFSAAYIVALLHDFLGIPMEDKRIGFTDPVGSTLDWTLGAFILQTVADPELETESMDNIAGSDVVTYISLFTILFLAILAVIYISNWRKPQFKTIYDLEKGHYIVTHLPR